MANSDTDAETVSALDRERQFRARSGDFAIVSYQPIRQALGESPGLCAKAPAGVDVKRTVQIVA